MTIFPFVNLTRATFRFAELGFFGVILKIDEQTPFRWGAPDSKGEVRIRLLSRGLRFMAWFMVANEIGEEWKRRGKKDLVGY